MSRQRKAPNERSADASGLRFGIVVSDYHPELADRLLTGALRCLTSHRVDRRQVPVFRVPGAFEIPQAASKLLQQERGRFDALVCLGVLIRGETSHFDVLAHAVARALCDTARRARVPIAFGVLTVENEKQARERSGDGSSGKGWEAARAAVRMATLYRELDEEETPRRDGRRRR